MRSIPLLLFFCLGTSSALNILVYNVKFAVSHSNFMGKVADELASAGHNVTSLISELLPPLKDGTSKTKIVRVALDPDAGERWLWRITLKDYNPYTRIDDFSYQIENSWSFAEAFARQCASLVKDKELLQSLTESQFDVFITETIDYCGVGLHHAIKSKTLITVSSAALLELNAREFGMSSQTSYIPAWRYGLMNIQSVWERILNTYLTFTGDYYLWKTREACERVFKDQYGSEFPDLASIVSTSVYHFTNSDPILDFARPVLPKILSIGGIAVGEPKQLDKRWQDVLATTDQAVIISFGSIAKSVQLEPNMKEVMLKTFSSWPNVSFIWKYEEDDEFTKSVIQSVPNVHFAPWLPQNDLLAHPKVRGFISHGGAGSCFEAAKYGVPAIYVPLFADQSRNAAMMQHSGVGVFFSKFGLDNQKLFESAVRTLLTDERLAQRAEKVSQLLSKRPMSPSDVLVKHVEFAAEMGSFTRMQPLSTQLSLVQYYLIDAALLLLTIVSLTLVVFHRLVTLFIARRPKAKVE